jgi:hypothetical protein
MNDFTLADCVGLSMRTAYWKQRIRLKSFDQVIVIYTENEYRIDSYFCSKNTSVLNARRVLRIPENNWQETDSHAPNQ